MFNLSEMVTKITNAVRKGGVMKLPKKVCLNGYDWDVVIDPKMYGGRFETSSKRLTIGGILDNEKFEVFLHEAIEAILTIRGHRYTIYGNGTNDRLLFSFYHHEFESLIKDIMYALKDVIKK